MTIEKLTDEERYWVGNWPEDWQEKVLRIIDQQAARIAELDGALERVEQYRKRLCVMGMVSEAGRLASAMHIPGDGE